MDDFKATGSREFLEWLRDLLKRTFGDNVKMTIEDTFIHTGIRHRVIRTDGEKSPSASQTRDKGGPSRKFKILLDQDDYAAALKPVEHHSLATTKD